MKKLRFKNRNEKLYYGFDGVFKSSGLKYTTVNRNIILNQFNNGLLDEKLGIKTLGIVKEIPKVTDLIDEILEQKDKQLKPTSYRVYDSIYRNNIIPYFTDILINEIKPLDIKKWQIKLIKKGLKKDSCNIARGLLICAFDEAILQEYITINPVNMVKLQMPKVEEIEIGIEPFTLNEIDLILSDKVNMQVRNFLAISFFTGARSGEIVGLKWDDIDMNTKTISIKRTVTNGFEHKPKTKSSQRVIDIISQLESYIKSQKMLTGLKNSYVFLNPKNKRFNSNQYFHINFKKLQSKLNIKYRTLHNTRHTFASIMLNNKVETLWVSSMLGHKNLNITLGIYTHFMPKDEAIKIDFLENRYKNGTDEL